MDASSVLALPSDVESVAHESPIAFLEIDLALLGGHQCRGCVGVGVPLQKVLEAFPERTVVVIEPASIGERKESDL